MRLNAMAVVIAADLELCSTHATLAKKPTRYHIVDRVPGPDGGWDFAMVGF